MKNKTLKMEHEKRKINQQKKICQQKKIYMDNCSKINKIFIFSYISVQFHPNWAMVAKAPQSLEILLNNSF
jgi:hypothetical protein